MSRKVWISLLCIAVLVGGFIAIIATADHYIHLPERLSQHETILVGQSRLVPGSQAAFHVQVRDSKDASPLADAHVRVLLKPEDGGKAVELFKGSTNADGAANVSFTVPEKGGVNQTLVIETDSSLGEDMLERPVQVEREYRILLTTDKPIYQPGQVIHLRALALSAFDLKPAQDQKLQVIIADGKGNKVFRKDLTTSEYGAASVDFQLASEVNTGNYKITTQMGTVSSEKTVTVEHYVLPKYKIALETERDFYQPGQHVKGTLQANYFFGKPVNEAKIKIEGFTYDVERVVAVTLEGSTDADGNFEFEFDLPGYIAGSDLDGGLGRFYLQAALTDQAAHTEIANLSLPVSGSALVIEAVPEAGVFRSGVENILYILTSYPDGSPAVSEIWVDFHNTGQQMQAETGKYGLAEVRYTPLDSGQSLLVTAKDERGNVAQREFFFEGDWMSASILLRPDQPVYRVGDTMNLTFLSSIQQGSMYLDIVREGQTISTRSVEIQNGKAVLGVDLSPDMFGTLELHAYKLLPDGSIVRDTRMVVVDQAEGLQINLTAGKESYLPGDPASIGVHVQGQDGQGVQSAIGLAVVDEAVFALAESDPGFAKLYFLLEQEIMTPRYDIHGLSVSQLVSRDALPPDQPELRQSVDAAAQASLAEAVRANLGPGMSPFTLEANSHQQAVERAYQLRSKYFDGLTRVILALGVLIPLAMLILAVYAAWRAKKVVASLAIIFGLALVLVLAFFLWPLGPDAQWVQTPLDRLGQILNFLSQDLTVVIAVLALAGVVGFISLIIIAIVKKDGLLGWQVGLVVAYVLTLVTLIATANYANLGGDEMLVWLFIGLLMVPLGFLLRFGTFAATKRTFAAVVTFPLALFMLIGFLPVLAMGSVGAMGAMAPAALPEAGPPDQVFVEKEMLVQEAVPLVMATQSVAADEAGKVGGESKEEGTTGAQPPRLRQYFPETMLWLPDGVTDAQGDLQVDFTAADSITTWRITALASSQDGRLGSATGPLKVFQDFFIDLDLPVSLTVGDVVSVPVGVFNYLPEAQTVRLELELADWFELQDEPVKEMTIASNDISVVYFRIKAVQFGSQPFQVTAIGSRMSDAMLKQVRVYPNGKPIQVTASDKLGPGKPAVQSIDIPAEAIPGTQKLVVKIYPGVVSQVVEGLDSILRMPYGCFEQTSSTTYPNLLVMDYLKTTGQASPEVQMKAEEYINLGYQRLVTFEVGSTGGFSLFGDPPADRMLTAYGLQEFSDMARVHDVDPALIQRAAEWLLSQQTADGSWENDRGLVHESTWSSLQNDRLPVTAYIVWSLIEAGYLDDSRTQKGLQYIREFSGQADDPYVLALVANALVAADETAHGGTEAATVKVLDKLAGLAQHDGESVYWNSQIATFMGGEGQTGSIETTALAAYAFLRNSSYADLTNGSLVYLIRQKDSYGTWYSTQATVLSLKALIQSVRSGSEKINADVTITLNNSQKRSLKVTPENFDVVQLIAFEDVNVGRGNQIAIEMSGEGNLMYQVTGSFYLPWETLAQYPDLAPQNELVKIDVAYDRTELAVDDTITVKVTVTLNQPGGKADSALIDLGLPPGFTVQTEDLSALVNRFTDVPSDYQFAMIKRYELTGRQILIYIQNLSDGQPLEFSYRLRAKYPLEAQVPASSAYDYYNPDVNGESQPQRLVVVEP